MFKIVIVVVVALVVAWLLVGRRRSGRVDPPKDSAAKAKKADSLPQAMLACAHCGVHLPQSDAIADAEGRLFCSDAHRLAGPR